MAWDIPGAIKSVAEAFLDVFHWKTGGREKALNELIAEEERLNHAYWLATSNRDYLLADSLYHQLRRVRDQAKSRRTGT